MAELAASKQRRTRRRADAERNVAAILDAALTLLAERPDASMAEIAAAAGVTRQTVYAHYDSREALLADVGRRALEETLAAIDAAEPERGEPAEALDRLVESWWRSVGRHARFLDALSSAFPTAADVRQLHAPLLDRLRALARRGQRSGDFDPDADPDWLAAAFLGLMHTAAEEVAADRLSSAQAAESLRSSVRSVFSAT